MNSTFLTILSVWMLTFCNPTRRAYEEGHYEPTTCPLEPGCGERLVAADVTILNELKPQRPLWFPEHSSLTTMLQSHCMIERFGRVEQRRDMIKLGQWLPRYLPFRASWQTAIRPSTRFLGSL